MIALSKCPVGGTQLRGNFGCVAAALSRRIERQLTQPVSSMYLQTTCCVPPTGHLHVAIIEMRRRRIIGGSAADFTSGRLLNISTGFCIDPEEGLFGAEVGDGVAAGYFQGVDADYGNNHH